MFYQHWVFIHLIFLCLTLGLHSRIFIFSCTCFQSFFHIGLLHLSSISLMFVLIFLCIGHNFTLINLLASVVFHCSRSNLSSWYHCISRSKDLLDLSFTFINLLVSLMFHLCLAWSLFRNLNTNTYLIFINIWLSTVVSLRFTYKWSCVLLALVSFHSKNEHNHQHKHCVLGLM